MTMVITIDFMYVWLPLPMNDVLRIGNWLCVRFILKYTVFYLPFMMMWCDNNGDDGGFCVHMIANDDEGGDSHNKEDGCQL